SAAASRKSARRVARGRSPTKARATKRHPTASTRRRSARAKKPQRANHERRPAMDVKPAMVKELRERTGAGMMDCKKALVEASGDLDAAAELLRKQGQAKADKKSSRVAAEGRVVLKSDAREGRYALVEVNSDDDFVAKDDNVRGFGERVARVVLDKRPANVEALMGLAADGRTVEESRLELVTKVGENINVRRFEVVESKGSVGTYVHGARIGVLVELEGGTPELARDMAMQV